MLLTAFTRWRCCADRSCIHYILVVYMNNAVVCGVTAHRDWSYGHSVLPADSVVGSASQLRTYQTKVSR